METSDKEVIVTYALFPTNVQHCRCGTLMEVFVIAPL